MSFIIHVHNQSSLPAIQVVQNVYHTLGLVQTLEKDGSDWTRDFNQGLGIQHSYSENYGVSPESVIAFVSSSTWDSWHNRSVGSNLLFIQLDSVAGGRTDGGDAGGESSTFAVTYDSEGDDAVKGQWVYIDSSDSEAKLALYNGPTDEAEVAGYLSGSVTAGGPAEVVTEGEIVKADWLSVAGTEFLTPGATYYLHTAGEMRITPPGTGRLVVLGRAMAATKFDVEINLPWGL